MNDGLQNKLFGSQEYFVEQAQTNCQRRIEKSNASLTTLYKLRRFAI